MLYIKTEEGYVITWEDGKFYCKNKEVMKYIAWRKRMLQSTGEGISYFGTQLPTKGIDVEKNRVTAYAFLISSFRVVKAKGDIPDPEEFLGEVPKGAVC